MLYFKSLFWKYKHSKLTATSGLFMQVEELKLKSEFLSSTTTFGIVSDFLLFNCCCYIINYYKY